MHRFKTRMCKQEIWRVSAGGDLTGVSAQQVNMRFMEKAGAGMMAPGGLQQHTPSMPQ